jgi:Tfp pilus assembly protein PilW
MSKKFTSDFSSNGAIAAGDKLLVQKVADSTVNYVLVSDLFTAVDVVKLGTSSVKLALAGATTRAFSAYTTSSVATAVTLSSATIAQTQTIASAVNSIEALQVSVTSAVQLGNWANAISAKIDLSTAGYATGLLGVICAELDMPGGAVPGGNGTYTCFEAEINLPTSYSGGGVPVSAMVINVWGAQVAQFDTSGYIFDISGVTKAAHKVFQDSTRSASQALRIRVNGTPYFMLLSSLDT